MSLKDWNIVYLDVIFHHRFVWICFVLNKQESKLEKMLEVLLFATDNKTINYQPKNKDIHGQFENASNFS